MSIINYYRSFQGNITLFTTLNIILCNNICWRNCTSQTLICLIGNNRLKSSYLQHRVSQSWHRQQLSAVTLSDSFLSFSNECLWILKHWNWPGTLISWSVTLNKFLFLIDCLPYLFFYRNYAKTTHSTFKL